MMPTVGPAELRMLAPLIALVLGGCVFLVWGALSNRVGPAQRLFAAVVNAAVVGLCIGMWNDSSYAILGGMLIVDKFTLFFTALVSACALGTAVISGSYLNRFGIGRSEYYAMMFFTTAGMFVLVSAYDLIAAFIGIELMSLAVYIMVAFRRRDFFGNEAAMKYFLLGAFAIAFFLYGMSLTYGLVGSLNYKTIMVAAVQDGLYTSPPFLLAIGLLMIGFVFKVSAVPFHMWVPDVYQGAPAPVTGFMATAVKAASFAAFLRLFYMSFMGGRGHWADIISLLAILTMTAGNIVALVQSNIKRMLAYSSIAHAGYILVGMAALQVHNTAGAVGVMYYVLAYAVMTLGAFALVTALERRGGTRGLEIDDYAGLGLKHPGYGLAMSVFMLSMAGMPGFGGFLAKYYVFSAAVQEGLITLVIIGVLNSALSLYYYLRVVVVMYFKPTRDDMVVYDDFGVRAVLTVTALVTIWLGLGPSGVLPGIDDVVSWTQQSLNVLLAAR